MSVGKEHMARYVVLASLDPRNIPSYYIVDTSDNSRVRRYDCELWAEHEARRMNGDREEERGFWEWLKTFAGFISK